ncbi:MAG: hypothetical protein QCH96_06810 [Candidatus Thermoplasmatota archaeon]|nr:hypothetical protein [Candidatus Thermoplasmatota archaeon]
MLKGIFDWDNNKQSILTLCIILPILLIIGTTPIHEMGHWLMSDMDPYIEPVEMHLFNTFEYAPLYHILVSSFGSVIIREKYPGAFQDRPHLWTMFQEILCIIIQLIITLGVSLKVITFMTSKKHTTNILE